MTFADVLNQIKNTGMQAFGGVFEKANSMLNSDMGQAAVENLTGLVFCLLYTSRCVEETVMRELLMLNEGRR